MDQFKAVRKNYPGTLHQVYLDTSTTGLFSKAGRDAMVDFIDRRHHEGIPMKGYWGVWREADDWRAVFADMIGAGAEEVFFG
jgi:selenocysteine lyase/cysteine desulfurase